jgi:dTDP-glucose 4,6-dehydratase
MNIVVAGAAGFLGSHLCDSLLSAGHFVIGVDNFLTGQRKNIDRIQQKWTAESFQFVEADVCNPIDFLNQIEFPNETASIDQIYYLASPASPIDYIKMPLETLYVGSYGCRNYLELAKEHNARFLLTSTSEVYGDPTIHPQPESYWGNVNPIGPRSVYDESKRYAESLTVAFHRYLDVEVRIARIFNTFGPRMRHDDGRVIPTFIKQALFKEPLTIFGDGSQTRSFCFCSDLVRGLITLMNNEQSIGPFNLGNPHELSMLELASEINSVLENPAGIIHKPLPLNDPTRRRPDLTNTEANLGWSPEVSFADGIRETIEYFRNELL